MPHTIKPSVYLIAQTRINPVEVERWLTNIGVTAEAIERILDPVRTFPKTSAQTLTELAGRRCYMSYQVGLNPNVTRIREDITKYLTNILEKKDGCYDDQTEVLTLTGWKYWQDVGLVDKLATRSSEGFLVYQNPSELIKYHHKGRMYRVEAKGCDLLVTPNHNMLVCPTTTLEGRLKNDFQLIKAECLNNKSFACIKTIIPTNSGTLSISADEAAAIGFSIGDGNRGPTTPTSVYFQLRRPRKIEWLEALSKKLNWDFYANRDEHYILRIPQHLIPIFDAIYDNNKEKQIPQIFFDEGNYDTLVGLFNGLMEADGCRGQTGDSFDTTSQKLVGQFQQLCLHIGLAANICYTYSKEERKSSFGTKPLTRLSIIQRELKPEINKWEGSVGKSYWIDDWEGDVFCAEVPNHTLYVRRNGIPVWSGNSVVEHSTFTFAIEGVSRVFTGEFNRHRAGTAISEGSMRYIRYEDIPYWIPKVWQENKTPFTAETIITNGNNDYLWQPGEFKEAASQVEMDLAFRDMEQHYHNFCTIWADELNDTSSDAFQIKKELTSAMRRIIGMGVATGGVWTGNIRALRHICEMRITPFAEEEICLVVASILQVLMDEEPILFGDFNFDELGFAKPKYSKV